MRTYAIGSGSLQQSPNSPLLSYLASQLLRSRQLTPGREEIMKLIKFYNIESPITFYSKAVNNFFISAVAVRHYSSSAEALKPGPR
jgi:hypothetical protein